MRLRIFLSTICVLALPLSFHEPQPSEERQGLLSQDCQMLPGVLFCLPSLSVNILDYRPNRSFGKASPAISSFGVISVRILLLFQESTQMPFLILGGKVGTQPFLPCMLTHMECLVPMTSQNTSSYLQFKNCFMSETIGGIASSFYRS